MHLYNRTTKTFHKAIIDLNQLEEIQVSDNIVQLNIKKAKFLLDDYKCSLPLFPTKEIPQYYKSTYFSVIKEYDEPLNYQDEYNPNDYLSDALDGHPDAAWNIDDQ